MSQFHQFLQDDSRVVIAEDDAVIDDKPETMSTNPQNVPKGINRLSCKSSDNLNLALFTHLSQARI